MTTFYWNPLESCSVDSKRTICFLHSHRMICAFLAHHLSIFLHSFEGHLMGEVLSVQVDQRHVCVVGAVGGGTQIIKDIRSRIEENEVLKTR